MIGGLVVGALLLFGTKTIVQADACEGFRPGDRVRLLSDGYALRVVR